MEVFIFYVLACLFVGWMASGTTLGFASAFLLSIFLTPITGVIVTLFYPNKRHRDEQIKALKKISENTGSSISSADELRKLKDLYDSGALTDEEYQRAKARVLA